MDIILRNTKLQNLGRDAFITQNPPPFSGGYGDNSSTTKKGTKKTKGL